VVSIIDVLADNMNVYVLSGGFNAGVDNPTVYGVFDSPDKAKRAADLVAKDEDFEDEPWSFWSEQQPGGLWLVWCLDEDDNVKAGFKIQHFTLNELLGT
jgi:hypothetical protein